MQYSNFGKFIRFKRYRKGISLNKFAIENEIDPAMLSRIENQKQEVKLSTVGKIASGFGMPISELINEYENSKEATE